MPSVNPDDPLSVWNARERWMSFSTMLLQLCEYRAVWPFVRPGGLLISEDVNNPALIEFAHEVDSQPHLVASSSRGDAVGLLRKF
jgi:hypothetical protein